MIFALKASKPKSKLSAKIKSKVATKAKSKVAAGPHRGRPSKEATNAKTKLAARRAYARTYYEKNRAKILKNTMKYYRKHATAIKTRVNKWRKKTSNGAKPFYAQGKANGHRPINDRLPRLNGKGKGRDLTTGKKPVTNTSARAKLRKAEEKFDTKREKAKAPAKAKKSPGRPKLAAAKAPAKKAAPKTVAKKMPMKSMKGGTKAPAKKVGRRPMR